MNQKVKKKTKQQAIKKYVLKLKQKKTRRKLTLKGIDDSGENGDELVVIRFDTCVFCRQKSND